MRSDEVRVGVIGRGFGQRVVAAVFEETGGGKVVDVVSPRDEAAVAALCAREDVDLISVHSPPFMHLDHVRQAIEGGHAVLCDKPFGRDAGEAAQMCALAGDAGVVNLLNFEMRYDPLQDRLRSLIRDGSVGLVSHVHWSAFLAISRVPLRPYGWLFDAGLGGGWIGAWGSHVIDYLRWALGEIVEVSGQVTTSILERPDSGGVMRACTAEDGFSAMMRTAGGVTVAIDSTFAAPVNLPPRTIVVGSDAVLEMTGDGRLLRHDGDGPRDEPVTGGGSDLKAPMRRWAAVVLDCVRTGAVPADAPTFTDGLACREVMDRLRG